MGKLIKNLSKGSLWREYILIFVCLGTKRFPFNRLLKQIDLLIENNEIQDEVFAQIGNSTYEPKNYKYSRFLTPDEYLEKVKESDIIISHGGTGSLINGLRAGKQVIGVPRRAKYGEHSDDHQLQIVEFFAEQGYIRKIDDMDELGYVLKDIAKNPITKKFHGKGRIIEIIDEFILNS